METIQQRIKEVANMEKLSIKELAKEIDVPYTSLVNALKKENNEVNTKYCIGLMKKYGVNPAWLLTGDGEMYLKPDDSEETVFRKNIAEEFERVLEKYVSRNAGILTSDAHKPKNRSAESMEKDISGDHNNIGEVAPVRQMTQKRIASIAGSIAAGNAKFASNDIEDFVDLNDMVENEEHTFRVKITGNSMMYAGIYEGDFVIVDTSLQPRINDIVIASIGNDEYTCKRLEKAGESLLLRPENYHYESIIVTEEVSVVGVVTGMMRRFRW